MAYVKTARQYFIENIVKCFIPVGYVLLKVFKRITHRIYLKLLIFSQPKPVYFFSFKFCFTFYLKAMFLNIKALAQVTQI